MPLDELTKLRRSANNIEPIKTRARALKIPPITPEEKAADAVEVIRITRPKIREAVINIRGMADSPYVQHAFSEKARKQMEETQRQGQQAKGKRKREPKDFMAVYEAAKHVSTEGWVGIPASAFRNASIDVCRMVGIVMTRAKLSVFVLADGIDASDGTPLVRIHGDPEVIEKAVRNESGVADIRWRPMWREWSAAVRVQWDEEQFSASDIYNLFARAGWHVGIGEGRPNSPKSNGMGWGRFEVVE